MTEFYSEDKTMVLSVHSGLFIKYSTNLYVQWANVMQ